MASYGIEPRSFSGMTVGRETVRARLLTATRQITVAFMFVLPIACIAFIVLLADDTIPPTIFTVGGVAVGTLMAGMNCARLWRRLGQMSDLNLMNEELRYRATHDLLMHVPNRDQLRIELAQALEESGGVEGAVGLLFLDLDRFKIVNDTLGHAAGDELLKAVALRIKRALRPQDALLARVGGDELVVLMRSLQSPAHLRLVANTLLARFEDPFVIDGVRMNVGSSIGMAVSVAGETADELYRHADAALYEAKKGGRGRAVLADADLRRKRDARVRTELALRKALEQHRIEAWLQPEIDLVTGEVVAAEALARWRTNDGVEVASSFIDVARQAGMLEELMVEMVSQLWTWRMMSRRTLPVALNVSAAHLRTLVSLHESDQRSRPFAGLRLEIAETEIIRDFEATSAMLTQLRSLGACIFLDDFGAGYSSLQMLIDLPIDGIKIDRTYVERIETDERVRHLITSLVEFARNTNMLVVAEGIETVRQAELLVQMGIDRGQGFLFSRAMDFDGFSYLLDSAPVRVNFASSF